MTLSLIAPFTFPEPGPLRPTRRLLHCERFIDLEQTADGFADTPGTFRYLMPVPGLATCFRGGTTYAFRIIADATGGDGIIAGVRGMDKSNVQAVVACTMFPTPFIVEFPRGAIDATFVASSPAARILSPSPPWKIDSSWGTSEVFSTHPSVQSTSESSITYRNIDVIQRTVNVSVGVPLSWSLMASSCRLEANMYLKMAHANHGVVIRVKILGPRAVEKGWVEYAVSIHPSDIQYSRSDINFLMCPISHVVLTPEMSTLFSRFGDGLPVTRVTTLLPHPELPPSVPSSSVADDTDSEAEVQALV